jgi:1-acyl-sn-glycerol-3-phosphate acyltransferase
MGIREQLEWAKTEWGILARRDQMSVRESIRWLSQWVPFGVRTMGYATVSLVAGPLTPERAASTWAMKSWSRACLKGLHIVTELRGGHLVPAEGFTYASNHQSLIDILVLGAVLPGDLKWAAKRSLMKIPFLGWHLALSGHVPVERHAGRRAAAEAIRKFEDVLKAGKQLLIFPEGTRTPDGEVKEFKNGGFYAAVRAERPIVPVAIEGTHKLMRKHASDSGETARSRRVLVAIGEPLFPKREGKERDRVDDLRDRAHAAVVRMHRELRDELDTDFMADAAS